MSSPLNTTTPTLIMASNAALENYDDVSSSDSEFDPPFLQPVNKEELLLARAQKRAEKKAEKHAKADVFKRMVRSLSTLSRPTES